jgi:hypothetical protein
MDARAGVSARVQPVDTVTDDEGVSQGIEEDLERAAEAASKDLLRFYELALRREWKGKDLPWGELSPIPELRGSPRRKARELDVWRSVLTQQLQADALAVDMATQLLSLAPDREAKLYYTTMVQDEARHVECWLRLIAETGDTAERDPYLDKLTQMTLEAETLEEKVFQMQVFYEKLIIPRFRLIARSAPGTLIEDLCLRLATDDGIHHGAGMAYERVLLTRADKKTKARLIDAANRLLPVFVDHAMWRPKERALVGGIMRERDEERIKAAIDDGIRTAMSLGLDAGDIRLPY